MAKRTIMRFSSANRAWNMLRLALLWARKGSLIKRKLFVDLHQASKYLKALKKNSKDSSIRYYGGEHELSFDKTPMIHVKMYKPTSMRFKLPCFSTSGMVDFDCDDCFNDNYLIEDYAASKKLDEVVEEARRISYVEVDGGNEEEEGSCHEEMIDERAEQFIAEFYDQMRLQRQMSLLEN